ncbi:MAG: SIR2 family protein [Burkholderiales bacterium]
MPNLFDHALLRHRADLDRLLRADFDIRADSMGDWVCDLLSFPWYRCYTLNIDNLADVANTRCALPRQVQSVSAYEDRNRVQPFDPTKKLQVVHLNGRVADGASNVTFSTIQYGERLAAHDPWYIGLVSELLTRPFVFIGTTLNEQPLWQYIELRQERGERGLRELRPRSYLVTPSLDRAKQALLAEYNVEWLPLNAETFVQSVLIPMRVSKEVGLGYLRASNDDSRYVANVPDVSALATNPFEKTDYLLGQEPIWADIQSNRAVERQADKSAMTRADNILRSAGPGLMLISGTAGSGKSTLLMRLSLRLVAAGLRVGWIDRTSTASPRSLRQYMQSDAAPKVLAIDDADLFGTELAAMVMDIHESAGKPLVVMAMRSARIDRTLNSPSLDRVSIEELAMPPLEDGDIGAILDVLDRENRLGKLKGQPRAVQENAFRQKAGRQLLVAMIEATSGEKFEERPGLEFDGLDADGQLVYALITVASFFRYGLAKDEILLAAGVEPSNRILNVIDQLHKRHVINVDMSNLYWSRHRVIAEHVVNHLQVGGKLMDVLFGLASVLAVKCGPTTRRRTKESRLLRSVINHDFLGRTLGQAQAKNLYGKLEDLLSWDFHYWLQRGSLELEQGSLSLAENFLNQSIALAPDDPFVQTEYAYLLLRKACEGPAKPDAQSHVDDALDMLRELIATRGASDSYPYHVLGSQGLSWARRGIANRVQRVQFLEMLLAEVSAGCLRHRSNADLSRLKDDLKREILLHAIK